MYKRFIFLACAVVATVAAWACTSAIVTARMTANGRPLLWKHRDTSDLNNVVERITPDNGFAYIGLFNASDTLRREAWMGCNTEGFAIMNTASYNLKADTVTHMDREGLVMSEALRRCRTVDEFEQLLRTMPKPLGVEANFGVIDAHGGAAYFETCNYTYTRFDVDSIVVRTNHSKSGRSGEGYGYVREANAQCLLLPYVAAHSITPEVLTERLSRSFYHSLVGKDFAADTVTYVVDRDFIPRRISSASVVVEGVAQGDNPAATTMWTVLGYPPCGVVVPAWTFEGGVPVELRADSLTGHSPACDRANELKRRVFDNPLPDTGDYLNIKALYGADGAGIAVDCHRESVENYRRGYEFLKNKFGK